MRRPFPHPEGHTTTACFTRHDSPKRKVSDTKKVRVVSHSCDVGVGTSTRTSYKSPGRITSESNPSPPFAGAVRTTDAKLVFPVHRRPKERAGRTSRDRQTGSVKKVEIKDGGPPVECRGGDKRRDRGKAGGKQLREPGLWSALAGKRDES